MYTTEITIDNQLVRFIHDGNGLGDVQVIVQHSQTQSSAITIPGAALQHFVAGIVRRQRIAEIEQLTSAQLLGLAKR